MNISEESLRSNSKLVTDSKCKESYVIGIDIDDTLTDLQPIILDYALRYNEEKHAGKGLLNIYGYSNFEMFDWDNEEQWYFWKTYMYDIFRDTQLRPYAKEIVNRLKEEGHNIYIITARSSDEFEDAYLYSKQWLDACGIKYDELFVAQKDKSIIAKEKNLDIFIDDKISNCEKVADAGISTCIMDCVHNKDFRDDRIKRIYSFPEFYHEIQKGLKSQ